MSALFLNGQPKTANTSDVYSTEEVRIGTWLGKPLYRRVVSFSNVVINGNANKSVANLGANCIIRNIGGMAKIVGETNYCPISGMYVFVINTSEVLFYNKASSQTRTFEGNVIIEYTKTTD